MVIQFLEEHPLCAFCEMEGKEVPATVVDHIIPHRGDPAIFWDRNNWVPLCRECFERKTGRKTRNEDPAYA